MPFDTKISRIGYELEISLSSATPSVSVNIFARELGYCAVIKRLLIEGSILLLYEVFLSFQF